MRFYQAAKILAGSFGTLILTFTASISHAQNQPADQKNYFTVESYYKVKWGFSDEFISLWKKNHFPLLQKALEKGDIIKISTAKPRFHSGEDTRWDFRVTILFKDVSAAFNEKLTEPYKKKLFPDQNAYLIAEQHRFELLLAHWDIETEEEPTN